MKKRIMTDRPSVALLESELRRIREAKRRGAVFRRILSAMTIFSMTSLLTLVFWFPVLQVNGNSMSPALNDGDVLLCVKKTDPRQGHIIAFYHNNKLLIKRVIATAGDTVDIRPDGRVSVNSRVLSEPYIPQLSFGATDITLPCRIPWDHYFVLGDSRPASLDSRSREIGTVPRERILGIAFFRLWPLSRFGPISILA